jgi:hypothetical protein
MAIVITDVKSVVVSSSALYRISLWKAESHRLFLVLTAATAGRGRRPFSNVSLWAAGSFMNGERCACRYSITNHRCGGQTPNSSKIGRAARYRHVGDSRKGKWDNGTAFRRRQRFNVMCRQQIKPRIYARLAKVEIRLMNYRSLKPLLSRQRVGKGIEDVSG